MHATKNARDGCSHHTARNELQDGNAGHHPVQHGMVVAFAATVKGKHHLKRREAQAGEDQIKHGPKAHRTELGSLVGQKSIWMKRT